jgi:isoleucyl-tRNA synthetase
VPIPAVYCKKCNQAVLTQELCDHVAGIFAKEGSDAWYIRPLSELVPLNLTCPDCGGTEFTREEDILDVWFDSGVSYASVVEQDARLGGRADLYLEGSDQHRGWFHTALLTSLATRGRAPYASVLTHGFTLDGKGRKMSKSLGNVIAPQEISKKLGAEILRLWVSAEDYREDVRISDEILNRLVEAYRRVRNTARFLISNLYDFDPATDRVGRADLDELDRWILGRTENLLARGREAYDKCEFHVVYHSLNNFCSVDLSAQYLDIVKDRLYCEGAKSAKRRAAQTTIYRMLDVLVHLTAPILSFTAEEIWNYLPDKASRPKSVFLSQIPEPDPSFADAQLEEKWDQVFKERSEVLKALELARSGGIIGHSLDAEVLVFTKTFHSELNLRRLAGDYGKQLDDVVIVSQFSLHDETPSWLWELEDARRANLDGVSAQIHDNGRTGWGYYSKALDSLLAVFPARGAKCERCWKYDVQVGADKNHPTACARCAAVLKAGAPA